MRFEAWMEGDRAHARQFEGYGARDAAELFWRYRCAADPACYSQEAIVCVGQGDGECERYHVEVHSSPVFVVQRLP